ncbi:uncharacterized protein LOC143201755 [Rhynchophorus ferrugineus]|uniref:Telomeric repeat-binding factor 2-interacting protein 1 n=1 Tax=Rhynchophorus ferrugineus TaxID=354439 RepID=A0A834MIW6_RHYFE|nr:hypothetical protein GWI33_006505 [Rhynchophorus ferrugineus]
MSGYRPSYTISEDKRILRYILDGDYIPQVMGNSLWKQMENDNICPERTWQSLKNRFRRHIMPCVTRPEYQLELHEKELLKAILQPSVTHFCETCHKPLKNKPATSKTRDIDSSSTDEENCATKSHRKSNTVTEAKRKKTTEKSVDNFFTLDMTDSSDTS